jgi:putative endopeptidase
MRRSILLSALLAGTGLVAGCATAPMGTETAEAPASRGTPEIGSFGFDTAGMDKSVAPGTDFYNYANGAWERNTPIPDDKSNYGMFTVLADLSLERTRGILEGERANPNSQIGNAYAAYLDTAAIEAKGLAPVQPWLNRVKGLNDKSGYAALVAEAAKNGVGGPFGAYVSIDDKQPDQYALQMGQSGLGLPDRDYYLSTDAKMVETKNAYVAHMARMLTLAGEPNAEARARAVLDYETRIARAHWTRTESRDANKTYNKMTVSELQKLAPGFDFATMLRASGANVTDVIVAQPSAFTGTAAAIQAAPVAVLRDQMLLRSLRSYASVLPAAFDQENFAFYGTTLSGTPQQEERWKRAANFTSGAVADEVSKRYVAKYFPPETKAAADRLVKNVTDAMGRRIDNLDWMAPETKAKARTKLAAFTAKIGYPDQWRDYSTLEMRRDDAFGNALRASQWEHAYNLEKLGKPIYQWEWLMTPMTVNAYAYPPANEIVFPAAILQPPFFDPNADDAINYGGIGAVIGHEISHHFDDQGSKYDPTGRLADWWTPQDMERFNARTKQLVDQYNAYEGLPGLNVDGQRALGENIADLAGLTAAWDAYQTSLGGRPAPVIDGFNAQQRFYLGWAQIWRRNYREADLRQRMLTAPHSPSRQRAWIVRNLDPWYEGFDIEQGAPLYLAPADRIRIW